MHPIKGRAWLSVLVVVMIAGCEQKQEDVSIFNPFGFKMPFGLNEEPVRIGIATKSQGILDPKSWDLLNVGSPWNPLRDAMQKKLKRPVQIEPMKPFQIAANLKSGRLDFGFMSQEDYTLSSADVGAFGNVLAVSELANRQGLIVANANSDVMSIPEISGKRFAFGPQGDPVLDVAAKEALQAAGLPIESIAKELVGLSKDTLISINSSQHHISSNEVAYEVAYLIGTDAGVIEASDYEQWPEKGGNLLLRTFSKDQFRVLGKTESVEINTIDQGPFVASTMTDPRLVDQVTGFLLAANDTNNRQLRTLGLARFKPAHKQSDAPGPPQLSATPTTHRDNHRDD